MHRLSYKLLLIFTIAATVGGILTLVPRAGASYPNLIGYYSLCTFAPAASLFCFFIAGSICFIRSTFIKDQSGTAGGRFKAHSKNLIPLFIVLVFAIFFTNRYLEIKSQYSDSESSASMVAE